jgi:cysteine synthase
MKTEQDLIEALVKGYVNAKHRANRRSDNNSWYSTKAHKIEGILNSFVQTNDLDQEQLDRMISIYTSKLTRGNN